MCTGLMWLMIRSRAVLENTVMVLPVARKTVMQMSNE
jgi:hypothetical protein